MLRSLRRVPRPYSRMRPGIVYLLCADEPIGNPLSAHGLARHYFGWTLDIDRRIQEQHKAKPRLTKRGLPRKRRDRGARLCAAWNVAGIGWRVAQTWVGDCGLERYLKDQKNAKRYCPFCLGEIPRDRYPPWHIPYPCNVPWPDDLPF